MSTFTPTLIVVATKAEVAEMAEQGITLEDARQQFVQFFKTQDIANKLTFTATRVLVAESQDWETPLYLTAFNAMVVAKFEMEGDFYLKLATGDVVALDFSIID